MPYNPTTLCHNLRTYTELFLSKPLIVRLKKTRRYSKSLTLFTRVWRKRHYLQESGSKMETSDNDFEPYHASCAIQLDHAISSDNPFLPISQIRSHIVVSTVP